VQLQLVLPSSAWDSLDTSAEPITCNPKEYLMRNLVRLCLILLLSCVAVPKMTADAYVRKGATGANSGTDWANAWNELSQINFNRLTCGETVWIAGGNYKTALAGNKSCTAGNVLTFARVLATDTKATTAAGWNSSFDSQVILPYIDVPGPAAYITIDGRKMNGIQVLIPGTSGDGIDGGNGAGDGVNQPIDHITFTNIEIYGPACVTNGNCTGGGVMGINVMPYCKGANRTNLMFDHMTIHRTGEAVRGCGWDHSTIQYSLIYDTANDGQQHEDILYSNPPYQNVTWRYNKIFASPNDGIFFEYGPGAVNFSFYGNVVYHSGGWLMCFKAAQGDTYGPVHIYNNVFQNDTTFGDYQPGFLGFANMAPGSEVANNVFENVSPNSEGPPPNANHNAYTLDGASDGGAGSFYYKPGLLGDSVLFADESPSDPIHADFHLTEAGAKTLASGKALAAPYNTDPDGVLRGTGGNWAIGAYQSAGNGSAPSTGTPTPPVTTPTPPVTTPTPPVTTPTPPVVTPTPPTTTPVKPPRHRHRHHNSYR
jgi:hypothetical protein